MPQGPASFYCPVSMELMSDPVIVATGHTYDRSCIAKWLAQGNRTCPVTGLRLRHLELTPNIALRNAIQVGGLGDESCCRGCCAGTSRRVQPCAASPQQRGASMLGSYVLSGLSTCSSSSLQSRTHLQPD